MRTERFTMLLALAVAACTAHRPARPPAAAATEVRSPGGDLLLSLVASGEQWELRVPGSPAARVERTPSGALVKGAGGETLAELSPAPADQRLVVGDRSYRVAFSGPRPGVVVLDQAGAVVIAFEQTDKEAVARDSTTRQIGRARDDKDRVVVDDGLAPAEIVTGLAARADRQLAALVLASPALPVPGRAALFAHILSR